MKKMFSIVLAAVLVCGFAFVGCKGGNGSVKKSDGPTDVVKKALQCAVDKDYEGMLKYFDNDEDASEEELQQAAAFVQFAYEMQGGLTGFETSGEEISEDGTEATVDIKLITGNGKTKDDKAHLNKTEKGWVLLFE